MTKKRALGRGLDALLGVGAGLDEAGATPAPGDQLRNIPVDLIQRGRYQPRLEIRPEALEELAASIKAQGVVQPVVVRPLPVGGRFELIAGERRWRAAQLAGLAALPAVIKDIPDRAVMSIALIENIQREQLNPVEEALALQRLIQEFDMTHQQVAEAVGRSRAAVSNLLRLLDLSPRVRELLERGELQMGHARALLGLASTLQAGLAERVVAEICRCALRRSWCVVRSKRRANRELWLARTPMLPSWKGSCPNVSGPPSPFVMAAKEPGQW